MTKILAKSAPGGFTGAMSSKPVEAEGRSRLSNSVADQITHDILSRRLSPGTLIGLEAELIERYAVSRATLREAVRQVEARNVARMRRGAGGGLVATGTPASMAAGTLATYFEFSSVTLAQLIRARAELEAMAAGMAAGRIDGRKVAALRAEVAGWAGLTDPVEIRDRHFALREMIAQMSGNPMLWIATSAFLRVTAELSALLTTNPEAVKRYAEAQRRQKTALVEALVAGDAAGAAAMVRQEGVGFLDSEIFAPYLDLALPDLVLESGDAPGIHRTVEGKLGLTIALRLRRDIVTHGWRCGENIGTEKQLRERYGVSRSLLREALTLLEVNGVVEIQRGREGGIVVGQSNPAAAVAAIVGHMQFMDIADLDMRNTVATIDIYAIGAAANSINTDNVEKLFDTSDGPASYEAVVAALYPSPEKRAAELICDIVRAYKPEVGSPAGPPRRLAQHMTGLRAALVARDASLVCRHMRGLWGRLDLA